MRADLTFCKKLAEAIFSFIDFYLSILARWVKRERPEPLRLGIPEALSSGGGPPEESNPRRGHRHPDLWRFPGVQPSLPCPGDGQMLLREGHVPGRSSPGPEKTGPIFEE